MIVRAEQIGKKFGREWIFRKLDFQLEAGRKYAITGNNGSGKTTLLKSIASIFPLNEGYVSYQKGGKEIPAEEIFKYLTLSGPYTEVIEEFTLSELIAFYRQFKPLTISPDELITQLGFTSVNEKPVKVYSSGMKQKLKLGLAFYSEAPVLMLDEPTSNFDTRNIDWYLEKIATIKQEKLVIICSNQSYEYDFCDEEIRVGR